MGLVQSTLPLIELPRSDGRRSHQSEEARQCKQEKGEGLTVVQQEEIHRTGGAPMAIYLHQVPAAMMCSGSLDPGGPAGVKL